MADPQRFPGFARLGLASRIAAAGGLTIPSRPATRRAKTVKAFSNRYQSFLQIIPARMPFPGKHLRCSP